MPTYPTAMRNPPPVGDADSASRRAFHARRHLKDILARYGVAVGGVSVIVAILLIFFYLLFVVIPLFKPAETQRVTSYALPGAGATLGLAIEEQVEVAVRYTAAGEAVFFRVADGKVLGSVALPLPPGVAVTSFSKGDSPGGAVAFGLADGRALVVRHRFGTRFDESDTRHITYEIDYPVGEQPVQVDPRKHPLMQVAAQIGEKENTIIGATDDQRLLMTHVAKEVSFLDETETLTQQTSELPDNGGAISRVLLDSEQKRLYVANLHGELTCFDISDKSAPVVVQRLRVVNDDAALTALQFLTGSISLLVGDSQGRIAQWFPVRDSQGNEPLTRIRVFHDQNAAVTAIESEPRRKGFIAADASGAVGAYHATAHRNLLVTQVAPMGLRQLAIAPRANAMLAEDQDGKLHLWRVENEHPEVSWSALWGKVWYESYPKPDYIWQSSAATSDFEPKFSLMPLAFGTLKAAFYAMAIAIPLAVLGAIFAAYFMAPRLRRVVKPSIEVMEALPTVILGFLAGLWLAPLAEEHLPGIFSLLIIMPLGILLFAFVWRHLPQRIRLGVPDGWEPVLLVPVVVLIGATAMYMSPLLEAWLFGGDMRNWLTNEIGMDFNQRNALVVGIAMGVAVIPPIFSIAEDALFGVPKHLSQGSLALGATPWQTLWRVVLLTASPGIFSAVMIGLGRAVGETMIVLMATGNTPVMDFSIFEGMRTLSANIAVEMPESEVNSTHYRVLFLAALVLFLFTFFFNTLAEIVRQRLRRKYSSL